MDIYQFQRSKATTNAYETNAGMNVNGPGPGVVAMPAVREQVPGPDGATAFLESVPSVQQAAAKRARRHCGELSLCRLRIDLISAQALAQGLLANHRALESLQLSGCEIDLEGTRILVGAMQVNTRLKNLVMDKPAHRTGRSGN